MRSFATAATNWTLTIVLTAIFAVALASWAEAKPLMGVQVAEVPEHLAQANGLPAGIGVYVVDVLPESPAASAGVEPGDVLVEIDGMVQLGPRHLQMVVGGGAASQTLWVGLFRDGEPMSGPVTLADAPAAPPQQADASTGHPGWSPAPVRQRWY